ncbi:MAG: exodeoxyribonuclease VII small subunit [Planctomycetota bacterium]|nr:exodeoxyribonuclease VII small subunit [Planctomycetota bacterium]MDI6787129.1 exodeoxyribonuclease VII small subunit [Planctomycetota bacterium]
MKNKERFEDYLNEVEKILSDLEGGNIDLEKSLEKYEAGIKALKKCYEILGAMEKKIEVLTRDEQGNLITKPFKKPKE